MYNMLEYKICLSMTDILKLHQNALLTMIALVHRTHANLTFAGVGLRVNALEESIHVHLGNANVVKTMNAHIQNLALLVNV